MKPVSDMGTGFFERMTMAFPIVMSVLFLVLVIIAAIAVLVAFFVIRNKAREISNEVYGNPDLISNLKKQEQEFSKTPRSLSDGSSIYAPKIAKDFPDINISELINRAENCLREYLQALSTGDASCLQDANEELKEALFLRLNDLNLNYVKEHYEDIHIHRTVLNTYTRYTGRCVIRFQSAASYIFWAEKDGKVIRGNKDSVSQVRYIIDCCYIQDPEKIKSIGAAGKALNCPNCGGVITTLGNKICPYCGTEVETFNNMIWSFCLIRENC